MVKKFRVLVIIFFMSVVLSSCGGREKLLVLNWGEYINEEAVALFEKEYNVDVIINIVESNEMFYSKIKSGTTVYDLVVPSEYMVDKLVSKDLIQKIDFSLLSNYDEVNNPFLPGVIGIQESMFNEFKEYTIPYFWGTFGKHFLRKNIAPRAQKLQCIMYQDLLMQLPCFIMI
jgi:spermidine/putrescine-binding protein